MRRSGKAAIALAAMSGALMLPAPSATAGHSCVSWYNSHPGSDHATTIVNNCSTNIYARVVVNYYPDTDCKWVYAGSRSTYRVAGHFGPTGDGWAHC